MKTIVTHISPDIDALTSIWLIKKFLHRWNNAEVQFVPAGQTLKGIPPDSDPSILHVDTGMGRFDHHDAHEETCAAQKVFDFLLKHDHINLKHRESLERLVALVTEADHFYQVLYPDPEQDRYDLLLPTILENLKGIVPSDAALVTESMRLLDAAFIIFLKKVDAENTIHQALIFQSSWGKSIAAQTQNSEAGRLAQRIGYQLVVLKSQKTGNARIILSPRSKKTLKKLYSKIIKLDHKATWFLHASGHMLLNGTATNPTYTATKLSLNRLVEIVKSIS